MASDMHEGIGLKLFLEPQIQCQILMRRRKAHIRVEQFLVEFPTARGLRADENIPEPESGKQDISGVYHNLAGRRTPAAQTFYPRFCQGLRQSVYFREIRSAPVARSYSACN